MDCVAQQQAYLKRQCVLHDHDRSQDSAHQWTCFFCEASAASAHLFTL